MKALPRFLFAGAIIGAVALGLFAFSSRSASGMPEASRPLSPDEYAAVSGRLTDIADAQSPQEAIEWLKEESARNPSVSRSCHELLHGLGRAMYAKYGDVGTALGFMDDYCISGYTHGVMEGYFPAADDLFAAIQSVCGGYATGTLRSWECFHGIGHGLMFYTSNDLPAALGYCETIGDMLSQSGCANGAYMENFNADAELHPSKFLAQDDFFYPCGDPAFDFALDCAMNAPIYFLRAHNDDYRAALEWCAGVEPLLRSNCFYGVGAQAARRNMGNTALLKAVCEYDAGHADVCIAGIVSSYVGYYASMDEAAAFCESLDERRKSACAAWVRDFMPLG